MKNNSNIILVYGVHSKFLHNIKPKADHYWQKYFITIFKSGHILKNWKNVNVIVLKFFDKSYINTECDIKTNGENNSQKNQSPY